MDEARLERGQALTIVLRRWWWRLTTRRGPYICDVAGCERAFRTMERVAAHERLHDAWRTR